MAPLPPLGRARVLRELAEGRLPFTFGAPHPSVALVEEDGVVRVRELVVDREEARRALEAAMAARRSFQPEHHAALGRPTGRILYEAPTRAALAALLEGIEWPRHW